MLRVNASDVPVTVSDEIPAGVAAVVEMVSVADPEPPTMIAGTKTADAPAGSPPALSAMLPEKPASGATVTV